MPLAAQHGISAMPCHRPPPFGTSAGLICLPLLGTGNRRIKSLRSYFSRSAIVRIRVGLGVVRIEIPRRQVAVVSVVATADTHRLLPFLPFQGSVSSRLQRYGHYAALVRYDAAKIGKFQKKTAPKGGIGRAIASPFGGCATLHLLHIQQNLSRSARVRKRVGLGGVRTETPRRQGAVGSEVATRDTHSRFLADGPPIV